MGDRESASDPRAGRLPGDMAKLLPIETVVGLFGVSWSTVYSAAAQAVKYGLDRRQIGTALHIGIDEISRRKGHKYLTQVYDLDTRTLLWSGKDRTEDTLRSFFEAYPAQVETVTAVCCDMWEPYAKILGEYLPNAEIVFDKFHLIRHLLDAVNTVRSQAAHALKTTHPNLFTRTRYVLLKNKESLTVARIIPVLSFNPSRNALPWYREIGLFRKSRRFYIHFVRPYSFPSI
ncbi:MAG: transposase [Bacteroidetes bacterium]|nr:transposase [Bacteroidota bacterium]